MIPLHIILPAIAALIMWWLSGFDSNVTGENKSADLTRRIARCVATVVLVVFFLEVSPYRAWFIPLIMVIPISLGLLWCGCLSDLFSRGFNQLIDSEDQRKFDANKGARDLETVANFLKNGRNKEALKLCQALKKSGDASVMVLETMLARHGIQLEKNQKPAPLTEAHRLYAKGKFNEVELILNSLLAENPANENTATMLMRLYARDLQRRDKAEEVLQALQKQPYISSAHLEFAQRSIDDWSQPKPDAETIVLPESVDELLALGYFGTAIDVLLQKVKEQPSNFDLWMKLAEVYAVHCGNFSGAKKILRQIEADSAFNSEQFERAKTKLNEWREARLLKNN